MIFFTWICQKYSFMKWNLTVKSPFFFSIAKESRVMYTPWQWESTFVCQCSAWMGHVLRTWENNSRTYLMLHTVLGLSLKVFPQSEIEQGELLFLEIWKHIFFYLNYSYLLQHSKNLILFYRLQKITFLKIFHILF